MNKIKLLFPILLFVVFNIIACENGGNKQGKQDATENTTPTGPAPDNSAATNPSLGDTLHNNQDTANLHDTTR